MGLCSYARRFYFKGSQLTLKWQLELLKILWSESISLKWFEVFCPSMSRRHGRLLSSWLTRSEQEESSRNTQQRGQRGWLCALSLHAEVFRYMM